MRFAKPIVLSFSVVAFAGAYADDAKQERPPQAQDREQATQRMDERPWNRDGAAAGGTAQKAAQQRGEFRASNLEGMQVVDGKGQEIGDIKDVVIDLNSGKVHAAVLEFGGILGVGENNYAFAPRELKAGKEANQLVLNVDKQKLESREGFAKSQWPGMSEEYWGRVGKTGEQSARSGGKAKAGNAAAGSGQQKMNLARSSELIGHDVQDGSGKKIGEVRDLVIGLQQGQVKNVVVGLDEGGGTATVPAKSIKASGTGERLVLSIDARKAGGSRDGKPASSR